jgi:dethiobiotin synthase
MSAPRYFVTGTDTGIGKTVVSTILAMGLKARYWKPIQTGEIEGRDSNFVGRWIGESQIQPESYVFPDPLSPHLAAEQQGCEIDPQKCLMDFRSLRGPLIIEGAGGVLVPLHSSFLLADLIRLFAVPTIIVTSTRLGTINHTLLTLEALRSRKIAIAGVITTGSENSETSKSIEKFGNVEILGHIPFCGSFESAWFLESFQRMSFHLRKGVEWKQASLTCS